MDAKGCLSINDLNEVFKELYSARTKWYNIGLGLHMKSTDLDAIKMKHRDDPDECFRELLSTWLKQKNTTWGDLVKALKSATVGFEELSETVQKKHLSHAHASSKTLENTDTPQLQSTDSQQPECTFSPQPESTDSSRPDSPRMKPHHKKGKETEQFQCPCGNCDLITYLDKQCPVSSSSSYPYLDVNKLTDDDREDLFQRLSNDTANIIQCFADLLSNTSESLRRRQITLERLIEVSLNLGVNRSERNQIPLLKEDQAKLKETTSIGSAFNILRDHMSFFNYELLRYIIQHVGDENDKKKCEEYCSRFENYCKRKVFEVPPAVFHPSGSERSSRKKVVVLATPDLINTLADVKAAQRKIATLLDLRVSTIQLERIDIGCVILVFSIPGTLKNLFPLKAATCAELKSGGFSLIVPNKPTDQPLNAQPKSLKKAFSPQRVPFEPFGKDHKVEFQTSSETERMEVESDQDIKMVPSTTAVLVSVDDQQQKVEAMDMDQIQTTFRLLVTHIKRSLKNKHVPAQEIASHAMRFGVADSDKGKLKKEESLDQLFILLKKYWSFLEYNMLESIVQTYGSDSDLGKMMKYKVSLKAFCNTPLSEMPQESLILNDDKIRDQIIAVVNITDPTFRAIMDLKIKLCTILRVEPHKLQLMEINKHRLEVKFMVLDHNSRSIVSERLSESQEDSLSLLSVIFLIYMCYSQHGSQSYRTVFNIHDVILSEVCKSEQTQITKVAQLISKGRANVNYQDRLGWTPLHLASMIGRADIVEFLIAKGARVNTAATGSGDWTPLHCASKEGHREVAEILLNAGAQVDAKLTLTEGKSSCDTPLVLACSCGHKTTVELLLRKNANVNYQNALGLTPLHLASMSGRADLVEFLIAKGARVNTAATGDRNWTPLHCASREGYREVAEILLNAGAQVDAKLTLTEDSVCDTPLILACFYGHKTTVELLLRKNANVNYQNECGWTPLHCAIKNGHTDVAEVLLNAGAEVDAKLTNEKTDLMLACSYGHILLVQLLVKKGASINYQNKFGLTALHCAIISGHTEIVKVLLDKNAQTNVTTEDGATALSCASQFNNVAIIEMLIQNRACVNHPKQESGKCGSALTWACKNQNVNIAQLLISKGANVDHQNELGYTSLHIASGKGNTQIVSMLIDAGAKIDIPAKEKENVSSATALILACKCGHVAIVEMLIKKGALVNYEDKLGYTPLHYSSIKGYTEVVEVLIKAGAHVNIASRAESRRGTALTFACLRGHTTIVKLLIHKTAFLNYQDKFGFTPLHLASVNGYVDIVELLTQAGAQVNIAATTESWCITALTFASMKGYVTIVKLLMQKGANIDCQDKLGNTPLIHASRNGHVDVVEMLINAGAQVNTAAMTDDGRHDTALMVACLGGYEAVVRLLLNNKAEVNYKNKLNFTPLHYASYSGNIEIVKLLFENGARNNIQANEEGEKQTAIRLAGLQGHSSVIELLILNGSYVNCKDKLGFTPLHYASLNGHLQAAKVLINHGAQITPTKSAVSPLILASLNGHTAIAELLIDKGANVNFKNEVGSELLDYASQNGYSEFVKMMRDNDTRSNQQDEKSEINITALTLASLRGHEELVKLLLCKGANIHYQDQIGYTPLHYASQNGHLKVVQMLAESRAALNVPAKEICEHTTPLILSCINGHTAIAELLIHKGAKIDQQRKDGKTALSIACWDGKLEIVQLLLKSGAKSDIQDQEGLTCLILATQSGHTEIVEALLNIKADPNITDKKQWSALFFASKLGNIEVIQKLLDAGSKVDLKDQNGATAYDVAQLQGHGDVCQILHEWSRRIHKPLTKITEDQKRQLQSTIKEQANIVLRIRMTLEFLRAAQMQEKPGCNKEVFKGHFNPERNIIELTGVLELKQSNANIYSEMLSETQHNDSEYIHIHEGTMSQHE